MAFLREYFFPFGCSVCGAGLVHAGESWYGLCDTCRDALEQELCDTYAAEVCGCCGKPLISEHDRCLSCRLGESFAFDQVRVLFPYIGKYRQLLTAYKFGKNIVLGNFFAEKTGEALEHWEIPGNAEIVPVPPRPGKIRKNGWDQVEYLATLMERSRGGSRGTSRGHLPVNRCLKRLPSLSQKELGRENRRTNLKGRIVTVRQHPKIAVLIDDVMTTGSTLDACASALKAAGTEKVYGLCLFYD